MWHGIRNQRAVFKSKSGLLHSFMHKYFWKGLRRFFPPGMDETVVVLCGKNRYHTQKCFTLKKKKKDNFFTIQNMVILEINRKWLINRKKQSYNSTIL